jgi:hypothetical protein
MANTVWSIVIISVGIVSPVIQQVGSFQDEDTCRRTLADLKSQPPVQHKITCVQYPAPPPPPPPQPVVKPPTPVESVNSSDARSKK